MQLPFTESVAKGDNYLDTARFIELLNDLSFYRIYLSCQDSEGQRALFWTNMELLVLNH